MTMSTTINFQTVFGNKRIVCGTSVISGDTATGDVVTGLNTVDILFPVVKGATQKGVSVNETFPLATGDVTVVTETNNQTFYWLAIGI